MFQSSFRVGLSVLLVESGVICMGSLTSVIEGKHYNRAVRLYKLGLERCRWKSFRHWLESNLADHFPDDNMQKVVLVMLRIVRNAPSKKVSACIRLSHFDEIPKSYMYYCTTIQRPFGTRTSKWYVCCWHSLELLEIVTARFTWHPFVSGGLGCLSMIVKLLSLLTC